MGIASKASSSLWLVLTIAVLLGAIPVRAEVTVGEYRSSSGGLKDNLRAFLKGIEFGFALSNADLASRKHPEIYCLPGAISLTLEQDRQLVLSYASEQPGAEYQGVGWLLL